MIKNNPRKGGNAWWVLTIFIWFTIIASIGYPSPVAIMAWAVILPIALFYRYSVHKEREKKHQETIDYKARLKQSLSDDWTYRAMKYNFILIAGGICVIFILFLISDPKRVEEARIKERSAYRDVEKDYKACSDGLTAAKLLYGKSTSPWEHASLISECMKRKGYTWDTNKNDWAKR